MSLARDPAASATEAEAALFDVVDAFEQAYEAAATSQSLSVAQACVLGRLSTTRGMGVLAQEIGCDASNITQIVTRMEKRGLVTRQPDPADGRGRVLARTQAGDELNARFEDAFEFARRAVGQLSADEQKQLTSLLRRLLAD